MRRNYVFFTKSFFFKADEGAPDRERQYATVTPGQGAEQETMVTPGQGAEQETMGSTPQTISVPVTPGAQEEESLPAVGSMMTPGFTPGGVGSGELSTEGRMMQLPGSEEGITSPGHHYDLYRENKDKWAPKDAFQLDLDNYELLKNRLHGKDRYNSTALFFGDYYGLSDLSKEDPHKQDFMLYDKDRNKIGDLGMKLYFSTPQELSDSLGEEIPALKDAKGNVIVDYLDDVQLPEHHRGKHFVDQMVSRKESLLRHATSKLDPEEKKQAYIMLDAGYDIGPYYWATQGFRYRNPESRENHLDTVQGALAGSFEDYDELKDYWESREGDIRKNSSGYGDPMRFPLLNEDGELMSLKDAGYSEEDIDELVNKLEEGKEEGMEPWEILGLEPDIEDAEPLYIRGGIGYPPPEDKKLHRVSLMKYLLLNSGLWEGMKRAHPHDDKDHEGHAFADRIRSKKAKRAAQAGRSWEWLGDDVNRRLK